MKIGFFDSGVGGLSVLSLAAEKIKYGEFIYYADLDNVPYGEKTVEEVKRLSNRAVSFLVSKGARAIVFACNTATSAAIADIRAKYNMPIIGMEPAVKRAVDTCKAGKILVAATPITVGGEKLRRLVTRVDDRDRVELVALSRLVHFAEKGEFESESVNQYIKDSLSAYDVKEYSALVLGCTHFIYFKERFSELYPNLELVDGNEGTVNQLIRRIDEEIPQYKDGAKLSFEFYTSGRTAEKREAEKYASLIERCARQVKKIT